MAYVAAIGLLALSSPRARAAQSRPYGHGSRAVRRVPRLTDSTLPAARARATRAGCHLRLVTQRGARATGTVVRQLPRAAHIAHVVEVWLAPAPGHPPRAQPGPSSRRVEARAPARGLATIPLAPGSYTIQGAFANATINGRPMQSFPQSVTIPAGETVRQDVTASIP